MKPKILSCLFLSFLLCFHGNAKEIIIRIAATSDVHGCLFPYDFEENREGKNSLAGVLYLVDSLRNIKNSDLLLLDNGDLVQGTPVAYYANFVQESHKNLFARVLNFMKYDAATVGNHDIEAGPVVYNKLKGDFRFPYLGANVINLQNGKPYFQPYTIIKKMGLRIAVIGLTTTGVPRWLPKHLWEGLSFNDMVDAAGRWVMTVKENENPDLVVGLFHSGYGGDQAGQPGNLLEDAGRYIALNIPGFDVIVLGHDHRPRNEIVTGKAGNRVLVLNPGNAAENLAVAKLTFTSSDDNKPKLTATEGFLIKTGKSTSGKKYTRRFRSDRNEILAFANQEVGMIDAPMPAVDALFGNSSTTDLIHRVQFEATGAWISFTAPLSVSANISAGKLYVRDLFRIYRYENFLYTMELSGTEIERYLEYSCSLWFNRMENPDDHLLLFRKGESPRAVLQNPSYSFDSAAGIRYTVDVSQPAGNRIEITGLENGQPFDKGKTYTVAINSYRGSGGGGHLTEGAGIPPGKLAERIVFASDVDLRTLLMNYIRQQHVIHPVPGNNWKIIPAEYYEKGKQRDRALFGK